MRPRDARPRRLVRAHSARTLGAVRSPRSESVALMPNIAKLKKKAVGLRTEEAVRPGALALHPAPRGGRARPRRRRLAAVQPCWRPASAAGQRHRGARLLREGGRRLRRARFPQQRHRPLQQGAAAVTGAHLGLLQAREDLGDQGLQERRQEELPRVRRADAEVGTHRRGVPRAQGVRRPLSGPGRYPADAGGLDAEGEPQVRSGRAAGDALPQARRGRARRRGAGDDRQDEGDRSRRPSLARPAWWWHRRRTT